MTHRLRILQPSKQRVWIRLVDGEVETDLGVIQTLEQALEAQDCNPSAGLSRCHTRYAQVAEGEDFTVPAGVRALRVLTPCDGSSSCNGVSNSAGDGVSVTLTGGLVIDESIDSITERAVVVSAIAKTTDISWVECE